VNVVRLSRHKRHRLEFFRSGKLKTRTEFAWAPCTQHLELGSEFKIPLVRHVVNNLRHTSTPHRRVRVQCRFSSRRPARVSCSCSCSCSDLAPTQVKLITSFPPNCKASTASKSHTEAASEESALGREASMACNACKRRKVGCSGDPTCRQCLKINLPCVYSSPDSSSRSRSRKAIKRGGVIEAYKRDLPADSPPNSLVFLTSSSSPKARSDFFVGLHLSFSTNRLRIRVPFCCYECHNIEERRRFGVCFGSVDSERTAGHPDRFWPGRSTL
jgi:hypothetical protein